MCIVFIKWCIVGKFLMVNSEGMVILLGWVILFKLLCNRLIIMIFFVWFFLDCCKWVVCVWFCLELVKCGRVFLIGLVLICFWFIEIKCLGEIDKIVLFGWLI